MPNKLYSIKPLEWGQPTPNHWHARTNLFDYHVICMSLTQVELRCVGDAGTESEMFCKNILEAKAKAQEDWNNRISQYLTEYKERK